MLEVTAEEKEILVNTLLNLTPLPRRGDTVPMRHFVEHMAISYAIECIEKCNDEEEWIGGELGKCSKCGHEGCASDIWNGIDDNFYCPKCGRKIVKGIFTRIFNIKEEENETISTDGR